MLTWKRQIFLLWFIISPFLFLLFVRAMTLFPNHFPREKLLRTIIIKKGKERKEKESDSEIASSLLWTSSETQGQIVGTRESLNGRENVARRKVKNGDSRRSLLFFVPYVFFRPFRLSLAPFICPWVSEDVLWTAGTKVGKIMNHNHAQ